MPPVEAQAFAPGRVNLIGEHTDYNLGLALPFAIVEGVTVRARALAGKRIQARATDLNERDEFELPRPARAKGWRGFVRGIAAELLRAGAPIPGAALEISGDVPRGAGLSSSAALEVSLGLALLHLAGAELDCAELDRAEVDRAELDRAELARLCSRVENEWLGAHTGLLDQLASLYGEAGAALHIDFASLDIQPVPLVLEGGWRLVTLDSGDPRALAGTGYNERRAECARACTLLGVGSLREVEGGEMSEQTAGEWTAWDPPRAPADPGVSERLLAPDVARLPDPLPRRVAHVLGENARVRACVAALRAGDLPRVGALLDTSHASLRDLYECSTPAVEAAVQRLREAGAAGARIVGGGFGGHVLGLLPPGASTPAGARVVRPSPGAHLLG